VTIAAKKYPILNWFVNVAALKPITIAGSVLAQLSSMMTISEINQMKATLTYWIDCNGAYPVVIWRSMGRTLVLARLGKYHRVLCVGV